MSGSSSKVPLILIFLPFIPESGLQLHHTLQSVFHPMPRINPPFILWMTCTVLPSLILRLRRKSRTSGIPNIHLMVQISPVFFFESACMVSLLFTFSILYSLRKYLVNKNNWDTLLTKVCVQSARVCLKKAFRSLHVPICGRFCLNEGGVAVYGD